MADLLTKEVIENFLKDSILNDNPDLDIPSNTLELMVKAFILGNDHGRQLYQDTYNQIIRNNQQKDLEQQLLKQHGFEEVSKEAREENLNYFIQNIDPFKDDINDC